MNVVVQLILVVVQYKNLGARTLLVEAALSVTCLAPEVHAYRVARGHEKQGNETFDPRTLLIGAKCCELVFEAVPGLLLQLNAYT